MKLRKLLTLTVAIVITMAAGQAEAQAHSTKITAPTPGLQIVQLRGQINHDMHVIKFHWQDTQTAPVSGWVQIVRVFLSEQTIKQHQQHLAWATRKLTKLWSLLGDVRAWGCIHRGEGAWNDSGDPYWGGLQMDQGFQDTYGSDMEDVYNGNANAWHPYDQMIVAERARRSGRGYYPWPNTARACGLI